MARLLLRDLSPRSKYYIQVRSTANGQYSEWTPITTLQTGGDNVPTKPVTNLIASIKNGTFSFTWNAPTQNTNGKPITDFRDYMLTFTDGLSIRTVYTTSTRFDLTPDLNVGLFGAYANTVSVAVGTRDTSYNLSTTVSVTKTRVVPKPISDLTWTPVGSSFVASWRGPTQHTDNSPLDDFRDYVVTVMANGISQTFYAAHPTFTLAFEQNASLFFSPQGVVGISVQARDRFDGTSTAVLATAQNPVPAMPTGLVGTSSYDMINLKWNRNPEEDVKYYEVYYSTTNNGAAVLVYRGAANSYTHMSTLFASDHYFYVQAIDVFDQSGPHTAYTGPFRPKSSGGVDSAPPLAPTGLVASSWLNIANQIVTTVSWNAASRTENDLAGYKVRYSPINDSAVFERTWQNVIVGDDQLNTTIRGLLPKRRYIFEVTAFDYAQNTSATASYTTLAYTPDDKVVEPMVVEGGTIKSSNYTGLTGWQLSDSGIDIQQGTINARTLLLQTGANMAGAAIAGFEFHPNYPFVSSINTGTWRIDATRSKFQTQSLMHSHTGSSGVSYLFLDGSIPVEPNTTYIYSVYAYCQASTNARMFVEFNDKTATFGGLTHTLIPNAWTRISIPFTTESTHSSIRLRLDNNVPGTTIWWDGVQVERQTGALSTPSQWNPPGVTSLDGGVIRTGEIRSSTNSAFGDVTQPSWSLNTQGNMQINDAYVRGRLVVGSPESITSSSAISIQSYNYVAGNAGWSIKADGSTEFFNGTFRGSLQATSGSILGDLNITSSGRIILDDPTVDYASVILSRSGIVARNTYNIPVLTVDNGMFTLANILRGFNTGVSFSSEFGLEAFINDPRNNGIAYDYNNALALGGLNTVPGTFAPIIGFKLDPYTGRAYSTEMSATRLRVESANDATPTSTTHGLQIGPSNDLNLILDGNEIMARLNGSTSLLYLNKDGGTVIIGGGISADRMKILSGASGSNVTVTTGSYTQDSSAVMGIAFVAPPSGKVILHFQVAALVGSTGGAIYVGPELRAGAVIGRGSLIEDSSPNTSVKFYTPGGNGGSTAAYQGLTEGATYNLTLAHKLDNGAGQGTVAYRRMMIVPST